MAQGANATQDLLQAYHDPSIAGGATTGGFDNTGLVGQTHAEYYGRTESREKTANRTAAMKSLWEIPNFLFNLVQNSASLKKVEIHQGDRTALGTNYKGAVVQGDRHIPGTGPRMREGSAWQRSARSFSTGDLPALAREGVTRRFGAGKDPNRAPPHDLSRYFSSLSVSNDVNRLISDQSQDELPPTKPTGYCPDRHADKARTQWRWETAIHGMQPGSTCWVGVMERSPDMKEDDFGEGNPLAGRRCEHLWLRDIGAAGLYLYRHRSDKTLEEKEEGIESQHPGKCPIQISPQQTPHPKTEFASRPKDFALLIPARTMSLDFGAKETHINFTAHMDEVRPDRTLLKERPIIQATAEPGDKSDGEEPIRVTIILDIDERTYPNGTYVDESKMIIKVEDPAIKDGEPYHTFELPFRMKKRALYPCLGLTRGVSAKLEEGWPQSSPHVTLSEDHLSHHWDLAKTQNWRDVQQFEVARREGNVPKVDVDRSIRFARHSVQPSILGYVPRESDNRSTFVGHITRLKVSPPMCNNPKWGEDVLPLRPAFIPYDTSHVQRLCPYGYIPRLGYDYLTGGRTKQDSKTSKQTPAFGVFGRSRSVSSSVRRLQ